MRTTTLMMLALFAMMTTTAHAEDAKPTAQDLINARCSAKWGEDYQMVRYCRKTENAALGKVSDYIKRHGLDLAPPLDARERILGGCGDKWSDEHGPHWQMIDYCNRTQVEAWESLR